MVSYIRFIALILIAIAYFFTRRKKNKNHLMNSTNDSEVKNFKKNEDGLYPWEVDTNDSPKNIPKDAKRYVNKARLKRGRW